MMFDLSDGWEKRMWSSFHETGRLKKTSQDLGRALSLRSLKMVIVGKRYYIEEKIARYLLLRARTITLKSPYTVIKDEPRQDIEGYLSFGRWDVSIVFQSTKWLEAVIEESWDVLEPAKTPMDNYSCISVQVPELKTEEDIRKAFYIWYFGQVEWKYRHWTYKEKKFPELVIDLHWETREEVYGKGAKAQTDKQRKLMRTNRQEYNTANSPFYEYLQP